ncbi:hypothetical protein HY640_02660 [Candidatus Woesearchaeota archaeon]|nr:hypothetical protein [Candidatus Woesearchaeota archaeon]
MVRIPKTLDEINANLLRPSNENAARDANSIKYRLEGIVDELRNAKSAYEGLPSAVDSPPVRDTIQSTGKLKQVKVALKIANYTAKVGWVKLRGTEKERFKRGIDKALRNVRFSLNKAATKMRELKEKVESIKGVLNSLQNSEAKVYINSQIQIVEQKSNAVLLLITELAEKVNLLNFEDFDITDFDKALTAAENAISPVKGMIHAFANIDSKLK